MAKFTNISTGPRGIYSKTGLVMVEAGETVDVELALTGDEAKGEKRVAEEPNEEWFAKAGSAAAKEAAAEQDPLDHDGDGRKGGHVDNKKS